MRSLLAVVAAALWISLNEFVRNQVVLLQNWILHYLDLGLVFPAAPVNGAVWGLWSLLFALLLWALGRRFSLPASVATGWLAGFVLMWVVAGNLGVLPLDILGVAVPWSLVETAGAVWVIHRIDPPHGQAPAR